jgi:iron complex outermembrane recepter protein
MQNRVFGRQRLLLVITLFAAILISDANANAIEGSDVFEIEEITVTAQRREQSIIDIPYNITAVSSEDLKKKGISEFGALSRNVAGLSFADRGTRANSVSSRLILRGLNVDSSGSADFIFPTAAPVSVYMDDTPIFMNFHLADLERVEVLRGPQGTLYGSSSLGGSVKYIVNKPILDSFEARVMGGISYTEHASDINYEYEGMVNIPLTDQLAVRLVGGKKTKAGFIDQPFVYNQNPDGTLVLSNPADISSAPITHPEDDVNDEESNYFRGSLLWDTLTGFTAQFSYTYQDDETDGRQAQGINGANDLRDNPSVTRALGERELGSQIKETYDAEIELGSLNLTWDVGFAELVSSSSYWEKHIFSRQDFTQFSIATDDPDYAPFGTADLSGCGYCWQEGQTTNNERGWAQELRLLSLGEGAVSWVAGLFMMEQSKTTRDRSVEYGGEQLEADGGVFVPGRFEGDLSSLFEQGWKRFKDRAVFGELTYRLSEPWQVTGGFRYFDQEFEPILTLILPALGGEESVGESSEDDILFKLNTSYAIDERANVYATWSQGFRRGGGNAIPTTGPFGESASVAAEAAVYKADTVNNYEIGMKGYFGNGFFYSAALFYIDWQDVQVGTSTPTISYPVAMSGESAVSKGVELEMRGNLTNEIAFTLAYAYTKAETNEDFTIFGLTIPDGSTLPGTPEHSVSVGVDYTQELSSAIEVIYHMNAAYTDDVVNDINMASSNYRKFDGYETVNASVTVISDQWSIGVYATNITDEDGLSSQRAKIHGTSNLEWLIRPRTIGLRVSREY